MSRRSYSLFSALTAFILVFSLAMPNAAFADDGQPQDPTPEVSEEAPQEPAVEETEEAATEEATPEESTEAATDVVVTEDTIEDEATIEESATEENPSATQEPLAVEETVADVVEALAESDTVLLDETGEPISLATDEAAQALAGNDPWFDAGGGRIVGYSSSATCAPIVTECHANEDYPIQAAINAVPDGGTVHIEPGWYDEHISIINKSITLLGAAGTTIDANDPWYPFPWIYVVGSGDNWPNVTISGLTVLGHYYSDQRARDNIGIYYNHANGIISNNVITGFDGTASLIGVGIYVELASELSITGNSIDHNSFGVYVKHGNVTITNNNIDNYHMGVTKDPFISLPMIDAEYNYWGCIPTHVTGPFDYWVFPDSCDSTHGVDRTPPLTSAVQVQVDTDGDTVFDINDNCPNNANRWQQDQDHDGLGNACDDSDEDGLFDATDNCLAMSNPDQTDTDGDRDGDACDTDDDNDGTPDSSDPYPNSVNDLDNDGVLDGSDNCPNSTNPGQADSDGDGKGNACDSWPNDPNNDVDGDLVSGNVDNCPSVSNSDQADSDGDGIGNACDSWPNDPNNDVDGDLVSGDVDNCPSMANPGQTDTDSDGLGEVCDDDDDNDGIADVSDYYPNVLNDPDNDGVSETSDNCPSAPNHDQINTDGDGQGNACDDDDDNDGISDNVDGCPFASNPGQEDTDGDGTQEACDPFPGDFDNDGSNEWHDNCPTVANADQLDSDYDFVGDVCDSLPFDYDNDGVDDNEDNCVTNANTNQLDSDSDGFGDVCDSDDDNDGVADGADGCPFASNPGQEDTDGDGMQEACDAFPGDFDNDGVDDGADNCRALINPGQQDNDGDGVGNACDRFPADAKNDEDYDGYGANEDNCPSALNPNQLDSDGDGRGNACDGSLFGKNSTTVYLDPGMDMDAVLERFANVDFPLEEVGDEYSFACVLTSVTTLDDPISLGDLVISVIGECSILVNGEMQTLSLAIGDGYAPGDVLNVTLGDEYEGFSHTGIPTESVTIFIPMEIIPTGNVTS